MGCYVNEYLFININGFILVIFFLFCELYKDCYLILILN